jgi:hypothetical protein
LWRTSRGILILEHSPQIANPSRHPDRFQMCLLKTDCSVQGRIFIKRLQSIRFHRHSGSQVHRSRYAREYASNQLILSVWKAKANRRTNARSNKQSSTRHGTRKQRDEKKNAGGFQKSEDEQVSGVRGCSQISHWASRESNVIGEL